MNNNILELEKVINYKFKNKNLLMTAMTHTSYANENKRHKIMNNERLEFLGDSVLGIIITESLFQKSKLPEGELTRIRATIVCETSLRIVADNLKLGNYLFLGKGEEQTGGRNRTSILSDAVEALIAAIYLDSGIDEARKFVLTNMESIMESALMGKRFKDYKTQLQEIIQKDGGSIKYSVVGEKGPDHLKIFSVELLINEKERYIATGRSKKEAEQNAAKQKLEAIKNAK